MASARVFLSLVAGPDRPAPEPHGDEDPLVPRPEPRMRRAVNAAAGNGPVRDLAADEAAGAGGPVMDHPGERITRYAGNGQKTPGHVSSAAVDGVSEPVREAVPPSASSILSPLKLMNLRLTGPVGVQNGPSGMTCARYFAGAHEPAHSTRSSRTADVRPGRSRSRFSCFLPFLVLLLVGLGLFAVPDAQAQSWDDLGFQVVADDKQITVTWDTSAITAQSTRTRVFLRWNDAPGSWMGRNGGLGGIDQCIKDRNFGYRVAWSAGSYVINRIYSAGDQNDDTGRALVNDRQITVQASVGVANCRGATRTRSDREGRWMIFRATPMAAPPPPSGNVLVSNVEQDDGSAHGFTSPIAQGFRTGSRAGGYTLTSVEWVSAAAVTDPTKLRAEVWTAKPDGTPNYNLATLTVPATVPTGWSIANTSHTHSGSWSASAANVRLKIRVNGVAGGQPPTAPTNLDAVAGNAKLDLVWQAPNLPFRTTGYDVHYAASTTVDADAALGSDAATGWVDAFHDDVTASHTISGLTKRTVYRLRVRAVNCNGPQPLADGGGDARRRFLGLVGPG